MTSLGKGFNAKAIKDLNKIKSAIIACDDNIDDSSSYLQARNAFLSLKREVGTILGEYNIKLD